MQRTIAIRLAVAVAVAGALYVARTQQAPQPLTVEKIADDLHVIMGSGGNVAVYTTDEGVILVDDKFDRNVPEILEKVKTITDKPVRYVMNTHHHGDHTGGNTTLIKTAEVVAHDNVFANMTRGNQPGPPHITFNDQASIRLGGKEIRAHYFGRGHTNGDALILFPAHRTLHTGDLCVSSTPFIDYGNGGSGVEWTDTLKKALALDFDTVIPGHGPIMKRQDMIKWLDSFTKMRQQVTELKHQGKSQEEVAKMLDLESIGWSASALWQRSLPGLYDEVK